MDTKKFINDATRTESRINTFAVNEELLKTALHMFVSAGTILDQLKRQAYYGTSLNVEKINTAFDTTDYCLATYEGLSSNGVVSIGSLPVDRFDELDPRVVHGLIGCMTEAAELGEAMLKYIELGTVDAVNIQEECFDTLWYQAIIHDVLGLSFEDTAERGINKLKKRFPDKFTNTDAVNRDLIAERAILEKQKT